MSASLSRHARLPTFALTLLAALCGACSRTPGGSSAPPAGGSGPAAPAAPRGAVFPVEVAPVEARRVDAELSAVGSVEAFEQVQVVARVEGAVERVRFQEGDTVPAGASLAEIEPERFRLAAEAARAALARAEAQEAEARAALARRESADAQSAGLYATEEVDAWRTRLATASATVAQARVAVAQAALDVEESRVKAPVAGIIQTRTVETGQYANEGDVLATLVQRDPLLLRFGVPEPDSAPLHRDMPASFRVRGIDHDFNAVLTHVAATADEATRMVRVTARVNDPRAAELRPGAFAEVTVGLGQREAVVVPDTAIRPSERGFLAFIVVDGRAVERVTDLGARTKDGGVEIRSGLSPGETVVVRGAEALRDGAAVAALRAAAGSR